MIGPADPDTTQILLDVTRGERDAIAKLLPRVYDALRELAGGFLRRERTDHTLQPTALVHEAYLRLVDQTRADWKSRAQFMAVAAEVMRRILVDHARGHRAAKRGGGRHRVDLTATLDVPAGPALEVLDVDDALSRLAALDERQARVVELRVFGGLSVAEVAEVLRVSERTVANDWRMARAWLRRELSRENTR